jgi:hypothetical protein
MANSGKRSRRRFSKPGRWSMLHSTSVQQTIASIAVCRLQRLGPRRARIRDTSMNSFLFLVQCGCRRPWVGSLLVVSVQTTVKVSSPVRISSGPTPSAQAAAVAARTFSTWKPSCAAVGQRNALQADDRRLVLAAGEYHLAVAYEDCALALRPVFDDRRQLGVSSKEDHFAVAQGAISTSMGWPH